MASVADSDVEHSVTTPGPESPVPGPSHSRSVRIATRSTTETMPSVSGLGAVRRSSGCERPGKNVFVAPRKKIVEFGRRLLREQGEPEWANTSAHWNMKAFRLALNQPCFAKEKEHYLKIERGYEHNYSEVPIRHLPTKRARENRRNKQRRKKRRQRAERRATYVESSSSEDDSAVSASVSEEDDRVGTLTNSGASDTDMDGSNVEESLGKGLKNAGKRLYMRLKRKGQKTIEALKRQKKSLQNQVSKLKKKAVNETTDSSVEDRALGEVAAEQSQTVPPMEGPSRNTKPTPGMATTGAVDMVLVGSSSDGVNDSIEGDYFAVCFSL